MSTTNDLGENISLSVTVLRETYKNLNMLMNEMDMIGEELGLMPLTSRFLRWKSDAYEEGWLLSNFIKIYQLDGDSAGNERVPDVKDGDVFVVEIDLEGQDNYPDMTLSRFRYDFSKWERMPAIADHWLFRDPYWLDNHFDITCDDGIWRSKTKEKSIKKYWGLQQAIGTSIPLTSITDSATIRANLFEQLLTLPEA